MGIWVVVLEAVAIEGDLEAEVHPDDLGALAEELSASYPVIVGRPGAYSGELWVEEGNAGGAILAALLLWQTAVRAVGLPSWHVARAEARDAQALEMGVIAWPAPPDEVVRGQEDVELIEEDEEEVLELGPAPPPKAEKAEKAAKAAKVAKVAKKAKAAATVKKAAKVQKAAARGGTRRSPAGLG
jgi:hypothetical protein